MTRPADTAKDNTALTAGLVWVSTTKDTAEKLLYSVHFLRLKVNLLFEEKEWIRFSFVGPKKKESYSTGPINPA